MYTSVRTEIILSRAAFEKKRGKKHAMLPSEFNAQIKDAEEAIIGLDTDSYDFRQRMEPLLENPHLNLEQQDRVMLMRAKLLKVLISHGLIDGWGIACSAENKMLG